MTGDSELGGEAGIPAGTVLDGKFRIDRLLGAGGMGAVYAITHVLTKHQRAMKLLHAQFAQQQTAVERFLREASAAGHIGNDHIIETFDAGWLSTGEPYVVMELIDGMPLADRIDELAPQGLPWAEAVEIFSQLCDGVQAAHDAGIVHRDLKPDNVFLGRGGGAWFVKILDFGISKFDETLATKLTSPNSFVGTPAYMSPEQFERGADVDALSDLYALGVILYEMLVGEHPYPATTVGQLMRMVLESKPPPPTSVRPHLPPGVDGLLARVICTDPAARIESARAIAEALQALPGPASNDARVALMATAASDIPPASEELVTQGAGSVPNASGFRGVDALDATAAADSLPAEDEADPSSEGSDDKPSSETLQSPQGAVPSAPEATLPSPQHDVAVASAPPPSAASSSAAAEPSSASRWVPAIAVAGLVLGGVAVGSQLGGDPPAAATSATAATSPPPASEPPTPTAEPPPPSTSAPPLPSSAAPVAPKPAPPPSPIPRPPVAPTPPTPPPSLPSPAPPAGRAGADELPD